MKGKIVSLVFLAVGVFFLMQVAMPFIAFKGWELFLLSQDSILVDPSSTAANSFASSNVLGVSVEDIGDFPAFISRDKSLPPPSYRDYSIDIPKIDMSGQKVVVYSNKFEDNLAQFPGTALPGEKGNVFITGHSSLSAISLVESRDRKPIFANLLSIRKGDDITLNVLGQKFTYQVVGLKVVDPKDTSVLNPPDSEGRYLTLMTCVPPGFNTKRLIVLSKLKES